MGKSLDLQRRVFLKSSGAAGAVAGLAGTFAAPGEAAAATPVHCPAGDATPPALSLGRLGTLRVGEPRSFHYPDARSPCLLIRMGMPTEGGVGPNQDVVAFSQLCTHMGCPVSYESGLRLLQCPCHYTTFDPERGGAMVCGQASTDLPRIDLRHDSKTDIITATGVNGRIFGRL
ncbi:arsenate reductase (azurin) small subunit [Pelomonas sp. APW6]|uniref:Arsenate reductase (Azurin) small subunit n=1 Tax=Roseateles subflavus TaxID=3053353 RepID=A0ABT7LP73_9BURK|nr:arsenate reductase (azurin) small subunit [Pelomonas sp. APW6]MDL5034678.1 arsenate reductase (azurin) small subunit [Pelomonas sp. APW6]